MVQWDVDKANENMQCVVCSLKYVTIWKIT